MVEVIMKPLEHTRTRERSCLYFAFTRIDGQRHGAWSRTGASNELARKLVAAGVPDAPMHVRQRGIAGYLSWKSFHEAARWTYEESGSVPLHRVSYAQVAANREKLRALRSKGQNRG